MIALYRLLAALAGVALVLALPAAADPPDVIALPTGFQPEGIAIGPDHTFYVGSIPTGAIYRGDLETGQGALLVQPKPNRRAIGLALDDRDRLFVAGGPSGQGYVYDAGTGARLAFYGFRSGGPTFVNDVDVAPDAAWFTDSRQPVLYRVPIAPDGALGGRGDVEVLPLSGDFVLQPGFNVNGIDSTPDGSTLVIVQSNTGQLFKVDPDTGVADRIELTGGDVTAGDGILLDGQTLYVVQNAFDQVAVIELSAGLDSGTIVDHLTDPDLDVPTTIDDDGDDLWVVNARFGIPDPATAEYWIARLSK